MKSEEQIKAEHANIEMFINSLGFKVSYVVGIGKPEQLIKKLILEFKIIVHRHDYFICFCLN